MSGLPELPGVLAEIAEVAGREAAIKMALGFGGRDVHIPAARNVRGEHPLRKCLGPIAMTAIAEHFCGESLYIPKASRAVVHNLKSGGLSNAQIAGLTGLSLSAVRRYARRN